MEDGQVIRVGGKVPGGGPDEPDAAVTEPPDAAPPGTPDARPRPDARPGVPDARPKPDAKIVVTPDARPKPDAAGANSCGSSTGMIDMGLPSKYSSGTVTYSSKGGGFFVGRDSGGLYAMSASCTHAGCTVQKSGSELYCPCHGATFDYDGNATRSPAYYPLDHYKVCYLSNGDVGVDVNTVVDQATRV